MSKNYIENKGNLEVRFLGQNLGVSCWLNQLIFGCGKEQLFMNTLM